jgi:hypothetical protein
MEKKQIGGYSLTMWFYAIFYSSISVFAFYSAEMQHSWNISNLGTGAYIVLIAIFLGILFIGYIALVIGKPVYFDYDFVYLQNKGKYCQIRLQSVQSLSYLLSSGNDWCMIKYLDDDGQLKKKKFFLRTSKGVKNRDGMQEFKSFALKHNPDFKLLHWGSDRELTV